ncbi:MAG: ATP-binding protein [Bacteroidetes bacterium]|nr:ATP-binding protein [Bacteroidota bacterium]MBS4013857.1 ATP-binding protein [Bacteroidota bacterium]
MVQKERKLVVAVNEIGIHNIERFVEEICDDFNIFNSYFGNIMMTVLEASENAFVFLEEKEESKKVEIKFWSEKNKLVFQIAGKNEVYVKKVDVDNITVDNLDNKEFPESHMIIKMLADEVKIDEKSNSITMVFYISSINYNTSIQREKSINEYFEKVIKKIKAHE